MNRLPAIHPGRIAIVAILLILLAQSFVPDYPARAAQTDSPADPAAEIWTLIPADATAVVAINSEPDNPQWGLADSLLVTSGLDEAVYGAINNVIRSTDLSFANVRPGQSSILGGSVVLATWGDPGEPASQFAFYVNASDPQAAYRSLIAQLFTERGVETSTFDNPVGEATVSRDADVAIMLTGQTVVITENEAAATINATLYGRGPTLAEFQPFLDVMTAQDPDQIARAYVSGPAFGQQFLPFLMDTFNLGIDELSILSTVTGQLALAHTSFGLKASTDGFNVRVAQRPAPFIGNPLPGEGPSTDLAQLISDSADLFVAGSDLGSNPILIQFLNSALFGIAANSTSDFEPAAAYAPNWAFEQIRDQYGIDIQSELLDQLAGDFFIAATTAGARGPEGIDVLLQSNLADPETVAQLFRTVFTAVRISGATGDDVNLTTTDLAGDTLYSISSEFDGITLEIGVIANQLVLAVGDGRTSLAVADNGSSLGDDPDFTNALAALPQPGGSIFYLNAASAVSFAAGPGAPDLYQFEGIKALVANYYQTNGLAMTDMLLVLESPE